MLSAVLLYGIAHLDFPAGTSTIWWQGSLNKFLPFVAKTLLALVAEQTVLLQQQGAEVSLSQSAAAVEELLLLCLKALERYRYPETTVTSGAANPSVAGTGAAAGRAAASRTGAGRDEFVVEFYVLVQLLCMAFKTVFDGLGPLTGLKLLGPTVQSMSSHAGSGSMAHRVCLSGPFEPGSLAPAAPPVSSTSKAVTSLPSALASNAPAVCRALEAFVRQLAGYLRMSPGLPLLKLQERLIGYQGPLYETAVLCSAFQPDQEAVGALPALAAVAGPGSKLQVQLFSLWSSLLKLDGLSRICQTDCDVSRVIAEAYLPTLCAETAVFLLDGSAPENATAARTPAAEPPAAETALGGPASQINAGSGNNNGTGTTIGAGNTTVPPGLMWIMLLGRCCLRWADVIAGVYAAGCSSSRSANLVPELAAALRAAGQHPAVNSSAPSTTSFTLRLVVEKVQTFLGSNSSMVQQLSGCGYDITSVTDSAAAALAALDAFMLSPLALPELTSAVKALGEALASLVAPYCCNNPRCRNISGPSDVALVSGKSCICSKCKVARYCGKACQQQHWRLHKPVCKALAAAQQGARSATGTAG